MSYDSDQLRWEVPLGSADVALLEFQQDGGAPLNLTGYQVELFDLHPALTGRVSASISDPTTGEVRVVLLATPTLTLRTSHRFRVRLIPPAGPDYADAPAAILVIPV